VARSEGTTSTRSPRGPQRSIGEKRLGKRAGVRLRGGGLPDHWHSGHGFLRRNTRRDGLGQGPCGGGTTCKGRTKAARGGGNGRSKPTIVRRFSGRREGLEPPKSSSESLEPLILYPLYKHTKPHINTNSKYPQPNIPIKKLLHKQQTRGKSNSLLSRSNNYTVHTLTDTRVDFSITKPQ